MFSVPSGIRTHDLLNAIETRSQLRHGPSIDQVDLAGFEPATSSVRLMRAPNCATGPRGGCEDCTQLAKSVSSQRVPRPFERGLQTQQPAPADRVLFGANNALIGEPELARMQLVIRL